MALEDKGQILNRGKNEHVHELQLEIGKLISETRIRKGLSIAEVEATTKISQTFIEDIELGNFEKLPGKIFGRGFIKNICVFLEIEPQMVLEKFERSWIHTSEANKETPKSGTLSLTQNDIPFKIRLTSSFLKKAPPRLFLLSTLGVLVIPALFILVRHFNKQRSEITPLASQVQRPAPVAEAPKVLPPPPPLVLPNASAKTEAAGPGLISPLPGSNQNQSVPSSSPTTKPEMSKKSDLDQSIPADKSLVVLTVKEDVKVKHRILPDDYSFTTFTPGVYRFTFDDQIDLIIFDAGAVEVQFNGKNIGVPGKKGEEKKLSFFAKEAPADPLAKTEKQL